MPATYRLEFGGTPAADDLYAQITSLEVEENADLPGAIQVNLPLNRSDQDDLTGASDARFGPFANLAVVVTPESGQAQCIFDGYVLSHKLHVERGTVNSTLQAWGQDASWLMNLEEKTREWANITDAQAANQIFGDYGFTPASDNTRDDSASHTEDTHTLMQRASDAQFLRNLARRNGKWFRVTCADRAGQRTGFFARPDLSAAPVGTISLNEAPAPTVETLDFEWDVMRPTSVGARQAVFNDSAADGVAGDTTDPGLPLLDARGLDTFAGRPMQVRLTTQVDDAGELTMRAQSLLREGAMFVRCTGEADQARLGLVLRVGSIVQVAGAGTLHSGKYLVWSVRHTLAADSHRMRFTLMRNAVGS